MGKNGVRLEKRDYALKMSGTRLVSLLKVHVSTSDGGSNGKKKLSFQVLQKTQQNEKFDAFGKDSLLGLGRNAKTLMGFTISSEALKNGWSPVTVEIIHTRSKADFGRRKLRAVSQTTRTILLSGSTKPAFVVANLLVRSDYGGVASRGNGADCESAKAGSTPVRHSVKS